MTLGRHAETQTSPSEQLFLLTIQPSIDSECNKSPSVTLSFDSFLGVRGLIKVWQVISIEKHWNPYSLLFCPDD